MFNLNAKSADQSLSLTGETIIQAERPSRARRKLNGQSINQARDEDVQVILTRFLRGRREFTEKYESKLDLAPFLPFISASEQLTVYKLINRL
jgi:hypothetical protein